MDKERNGAVVKSRIKQMKVKFAILFEHGHEQENKYHVFRIHDTAEMDENRMRLALYPSDPHGDYFIFRFDEEVSFGSIDLNAIISHEKEDKGDDYVDGAPIFWKGEVLKEFIDNVVML